MKTYKSHKTVEAAKILKEEENGAGGWILTLQGDQSETRVVVDGAWHTRHAPGDGALSGGYFVRYHDGYTSWSPAWAFEQGYTEHSLNPKDGALPVAGYKPQTAANVALVNVNKQIEESCLRILDELATYPGIDKRWLAVGRTHIEQGWMAINRAVFQPGRASLPGDSEGEA